MEKMPMTIEDKSKKEIIEANSLLARPPLSVVGISRWLIVTKFPVLFSRPGIKMLRGEGFL